MFSLKNLVKLSVFVVSLLLFAFLFTIDTSAQTRSYYYKSIDVDIQANEDSTMNVKEELVYNFDGVYRAVTRSINLGSDENVAKCKANPSLQCGGFEFMQITGVTAQGKSLKPAQEKDIRYNSEGRAIADPDFYIVETEKVGAEKRLTITWVFDENGRDFSNDNVTFTIEYDIYGGFGYFDDYDLLYWNAIFEDREVTVENVSVNIFSPQPVDTSPENLQVPGQANNYTVTTSNGGKTITIRTRNLLPYESFTVLLKYPKGIIQKYATLNLDLEPSKQNLRLNESINLTDIGSTLAGIPPGMNKLEFSADGRENKTFELELAPGEIRDLAVNLEFTTAQLLKIILAFILNIVGILLLPVGLFLVYNLWRRKGRDKLEHKVTVPEYNIPEGIKPFALGSLKDENVDIVDITSTIIDLAYHGYIKIKEYGAAEILGIKIKKPEFELLKLKPFDGLTAPEMKIVDGLFGTNERVTTEELKNKFYKEIPGIKESVYTHMVSEKYFDEDPTKVRARYATYGVTLMVIGGAGILGSFILPFFIGIGITLLVIGVVLAIVSRAMPSKTEKGSKLYHKVLGFKMYIETAEKYRVQNLTPEMFEKFLPYAMVFGVEKQWAEKFKDIYKGSPSWFEGSSNPDVFTTLYLANALSRFNTTTTQAMTVTPTSSGSASGGGWSGGGGFSGGFSGGGGGGGGGGAW